MTVIWGYSKFCWFMLDFHKYECYNLPHVTTFPGLPYEQWRNRGTIGEALHESLLEKTNFWQNVLERPVNVTLMLAKCNLPFRGSSEELSKNNKSNCLSIIQLLAKYETVLDKLLQLA